MARIWVLTGAKIGDNAQIVRAADAIGLPYEVKRIVLSPEHETAKPKVEASLHIVDQAKSDRLDAPWPDLVITIGRRLSMVALWIKERSGGQARIVLFNAPKGRAEAFDLIVAPAYYTIADGPRVCRIGLPLIAAGEARIEGAKAEFAAAFARLARPLDVLLLGGDMGARKLGPDFALSTLRTMQESYARDGSIYVSTSRRTPTAAVEAVEKALRPQDRLYRWREGAADNPYFGLLAHGDRFTVTSDSLSMLTEVARLGRPLVIAEPPERRPLAGRHPGLRAVPPARGLSEAADYLIRRGHAVKLGAPPPPAPKPPPDDTQRVALRLRQIALGRD